MVKILRSLCLLFVFCQICLANEKDRTIFIEIEADTLSPYFQAQTLITMKLFRDASSFDAAMSYPELSDPAVSKNAMLQNIETNTRRYRQYINDFLYDVTERQYSLYPEQSGKMIVGPAVFKGHIVRGGTIQFVQVESNQIELDVRPIPDSFTGNVWIPARSVEIYQDYQPTNTSLEIGKPISRNLFLSATGLGSGQIPSFYSMQIPGFRVYPRQTQREELEHSESGLIAVLQQELTLVPTASGQYEIPPIEVPWWNTIKDKQEVAKYPGRTITIISSENISGNEDSNQLNGTVSDTTTLNFDGINLYIKQHKLFIAILLVIALISIYLLFAYFKKVSGTSGKEKNQFSYRALMKACSKNDADATKLHLLGYFAMSAPEYESRSLQELADKFSGDLASEIRKLNFHLYSNEQNNWQGEKIKQALKRWKKSHQSHKTIYKKTIPEIYPLLLQK